MVSAVEFWDRIAPKYAKDPIKNMTAYEATIDRVRAKLSRDDKVLEFGCGTGSTAILLAPSVAQYTGSDISPGMIKIAQAKAKDHGNLDFTVAGAADSLGDRGQFDAVLGFNILHLVPDLDAVLARSFALLRPGGQFITKSPALREMGFHIRLMLPVMQFFGKAPYVGFFGRAELEAKIRKAGFQIDEARTFDRAPHSWFIVARKPG